MPRPLPPRGARLWALAGGAAGRRAAATLGLSPSPTPPPALSPDPYTVLGVEPGVSDEELRSAYRRLVQLHHPDHNNGSAEAARRFEAVQEAYAAITRERRRNPTPRRSQPPPASDSGVEQRLADLERELREKARAARERAERAAREAAAAATRSKPERPSDEELGYIKTDDSLGKILADGLDDVAEWLQRHTQRPE